MAELLAAMAISAIVIALAARIFLSGHREFLGRAEESGRLAGLYRAKSAVRHALRGEIVRCEGGRLWLREEEGEKDFEEWFKARFPEADSLDFRCFEAEEGADSLAPWHSLAQPALVEYRLALGKGAKRDVLAGSWLK